MPGLDKKLLYLSTFVLLGIIYNVLLIFFPPHDEPIRIGIALGHPTIATAKFLTGLKTAFIKEGYFPGRNLQLAIAKPGAVKNPVSSLKKLVRPGHGLLVLTGDELTGATAHAFKQTPVIFAFINSPVPEATLTTIEKEAFITGVSYFPPYDRTLELSRTLLGNYSRLTLLLPEKSVWAGTSLLAAGCHNLGINLQIVTTTISKLAATIMSLRGKTDLIYLPGELPFLENRRLIQDALRTAQLPAISNNLAFRDLIVLAYAAEPETIGEIAGLMAVKILHGSKTRYMPVELSTDFKLIINLRLLQQLKIRADGAVLSYANEIVR